MKRYLILIFSIFFILCGCCNKQASENERLSETKNLVVSVQDSINKHKTKLQLIELSKRKWLWMADRNVDSLATLFHKEAVFVHMGATMNKDQELNTIKSGGIYYKHADIKETSVRFVGNTAILLDKIRLTAIVAGNEVVNPFMVTEIYVMLDNKWQLGSLSFTRLLGD